MFLRNVKGILDQESALLEQLGAVKVGYHGPTRSLTGGHVWYTFYYKDRPTELYSGYFENRWGCVTFVMHGQENPKLGHA